MSATAAGRSAAASAPSERRLRTGLRAERLIPAGAALAALAIGLWRPANTDISWLLTVNERILDGATPYKDVIELNPPASILLYRLPVLAAHWLSLRAEIAVVAFIALLIGGVLIYARRLLSRYELCNPARRAVFLLVAALVLAMLPFDEMAQREHFATIFALPYALVAMARAAERRAAPLDAIIAGAMMGLCVAVKPHFALCALLVAAAEAWRARTAGAFFRIENLAAFAVALAYVIGSFLFFPYFFSDVLPMVRDLYLPIRLGAAGLIAHIAPILALPLCLCWLFRAEPQAGGARILLLIAAGFLAAYFLQGKGWSYHAYPALAFSLLAAAWALPQAADAVARLSPKLGALLLAAALIAPAPSFLRRDERHAALAAAIAKIAPHPKLLALSFRQSLGHPLTRNIGGVWVGRYWGLWPTGLAVLMKERAGDDATLRAKADAYFEKDRLTAAEDIEHQKPDIVLIDETPGFDFNAWIAASPQLEAALARYKPMQAIDGVEILQRRNS